jgi:hypothetical protein
MSIVIKIVLFRTANNFILKLMKNKLNKDDNTIDFYGKEQILY